MTLVFPATSGTTRAISSSTRLANQAASSFFLPLDRVVRALELVRAGLPVPRGTLMTTFVYTPYDELRRLGLREASEQAARAAHPDATGLLVVEKCIPAGVTDGLLEPGDILLRIADADIAGFVPLAELLDSHVGQPLALAQRVEPVLVVDLDEPRPPSADHCAAAASAPSAWIT